MLSIDMIGPRAVALMDLLAVATRERKRAARLEACAVSWCDDEAAWTWTRTAAQLKKMRGPSIKGLRAVAEPSRCVCSAHRPSWRVAEYQALPVRHAVAA